MTPIRALRSDEHVTETVRILEEALGDAKAGKISAIVVFADLKGTDEYRYYKSAAEDGLTFLGKMTQAIHDICRKH